MGTWRRIDGNRRIAQLADLHLSERGVLREGFPGRIICMPPDPFALIHHRWNSVSRMRALQRTLPGLFYRYHSSVLTGKEKRNTLKRPFLYQTTNTTRLITGYGMGLVMSTALVTLFNNTVWNVANELPLLKNVWQIVGYAGLCVIISGLVLLNQKTPLLVGAYLTVIMVMVIISMLYTIFWIILLKRENTFQRARELTLMFLLGFCTALLQVLLFVNIRGLVF